MHDANMPCSGVALEHAADMHQAANVAGNDNVGPALDDVLFLALSHGERRAGHLHAESAAETAALFEVRQFAVGQAADRLQQLQRMVEDAQFPPAVAADVHRDFMRKAGPRVRHTQDVDQELAELEHPAAHRQHLGTGIDVRKEDPAHGRAGARRADDPTVRGEHLAELLDHRPRFFPIARIERRLPAAGLLGRKDQRHAESLQDADHRFADPWIELIDIAGNEHRHRFALPVRRVVLTWRWLVAEGGGHVLSSRAMRCQESQLRCGQYPVIPARGTIVEKYELPHLFEFRR